jgi:hypothetical protein
VRHHRRADGTQLGMVFLVEAALGTMAEITRDDGSLVKAPNGFHSVLAKGTVAPDMYDFLKCLFSEHIIVFSIPQETLKHRWVCMHLFRLQVQRVRAHV